MFHEAPDMLAGAAVAGSIVAVVSLTGITTRRVMLASLAVGAISLLDHVYTDALGGR